MERLSLKTVRAAAGLAACLLACAIASPAPAYSDEDLTELQQRVESSAAEYNAAQERIAELAEEAAATQARIEEINEQLPAQRQSSADAMRVLYVVQQQNGSIIDVVLGSSNITDFVRTVDYLDAIQTHNLAQLSALSSMKADLERQEADLQEQERQARDEADRAERALEAAQAARQEAEEKAAAIAAQQAAEAAARAEAEAAKSAEGTQQQPAAAEPGMDAENPEVDRSEGDTTSAPAGAVSQGEVDWSVDKAAFVDEWAGRIDAYLAGTPLSGYGTTFAAAAWDYGVDPRWSPAISYAESSCGAYCFRPHNAWGWGSSSWGSWEEAINAHVSGLARVYGGTLTIEAAQMYCPPTYMSWYNTVLGQMEMI